jgi:hypothetical protein
MDEFTKFTSHLSGPVAICVVKTTFCCHVMTKL